MNDLPERIWACMGGPMVGMFVSGGNNGGWPEYIRADIVQALTAERDRLREALTDAWDAHNKHGDQMSGWWVHDDAQKRETP